MVLTTVLGYLCALPLPRALGIDPRWGVAGLTISAGVASWVEFTLLRRTLNRRIGATGIAKSYLAKLWAAALTAAAAGWLIHHFLTGNIRPWVAAVFVLTPYGLIYFAATLAMGLGEAQPFVGSAIGRMGAWRKTKN